jgi:hypothetical protein
MRLILTCNGCRASTTVSCTAGCSPEAGHADGCRVADLDAALQCTPGAGCCALPHHHGQAANSCPGAGLNHRGAPCPDVNPAACQAVTPPGEPCPGGHCGKGVDGCTACRPLTVTVLDLGVLAGEAARA